MFKKSLMQLIRTDLLLHVLNKHVLDVSITFIYIRE